MQGLDDGVGKLAGDAFLELRPGGDGAHDARQLGQAGDMAAGARDVGDVGRADERQQVMLAHRVEGDVAHQHHLVVMVVLHGHEKLAGIGLEAEEDVVPHVGDPPRRVTQTRAA